MLQWEQRGSRTSCTSRGKTRDVDLVFYLDTSAVLKRYRTEQGTDGINELYDRRDRDREALVSSYMTCLEVESVAARGLKGGLLDRAAYGTLLAAFGRDLESFSPFVLPVTPQFTYDAAGVIRAFGCRAADAIQMATAEFVSSIDETEELIFVASDHELVAACTKSGMDVLDPEADDAREKLRKYREK